MQVSTTGILRTTLHKSSLCPISSVPQQPHSPQAQHIRDTLLPRCQAALRQQRQHG